MKDAFHRAHEAEYGHRFDAEIEIINIRAVGIGRVEELRPVELEQGNGDPSPALTGHHEVVFDVGGKPERLVAPFYEREHLRAGDRVEGPAVIEQYDSTTVVPPGLTAEIDRYGNIVVDCSAAARAETDLATPILMRVIGGAFAAIAKEMAGVLYRMSYSSIIRESEDLGAGIFDAEGNELAESDSTPMFMGAMPKIVKNVIQILGDEIHEGDVILHNDPYGGATHSPDVAIVIPIFHEGELVGFSGASAHVLDIGGAYPGLAIDLVDNWSEGNIYRAVKVQEKGVWQAGLWKHIMDNVRTPTFNNGDIRAMIAACELAKRRYAELLGRYGKETVLGAAQAWIDYSERMLRAEIAKVPDGRYETEVGWLDDDGVNRGVKLPIKVAVEIESDRIRFDLTGSSAEVPTGFNCPFEGTTVSAMTFITRMIFLDEATHPVFVPQNEGMLAPVDVVAPKGSIFNPNYPRACFARFCQVQRAVDLALRALAPVLPDKITSGNSAHLHFIAYSGFLEEEGEYWVYLEVDEGSYGGRPGRDGLDSTDCLIANTRNNPIEELEWRFPMLTERYELRDDPCAAGKWRGGVGMIRVNRFLVDTIVTCEGERCEADPPWGIFGGHEGTLASTVVRTPDGRVETWPSKFTGKVLPAGAAIEIAVPNSGGYGDPLEREPALVLSDVLDGFTTLELAERDYCVVIDPETMTVDADATRAARETVVPA
jgi:5-oxoprolinase (ATP-hydrolysing)